MMMNSTTYAASRSNAWKRQLVDKMITVSSYSTTSNVLLLPQIRSRTAVIATTRGRNEKQEIRISTTVPIPRIVVTRRRLFSSQLVQVQQQEDHSLLSDELVGVSRRMVSQEDHHHPSRPRERQQHRRRPHSSGTRAAVAAWPIARSSMSSPSSSSSTATSTTRIAQQSSLNDQNQQEEEQHRGRQQQSEFIHQILSTPIGYLVPSQWAEVAYHLSNTNTGTSNAIISENIILHPTQFFRVMDRLLEEVQANNNKNQTIVTATTTILPECNFTPPPLHSDSTLGERESSLLLSSPSSCMFPPFDASQLTPALHYWAQQQQQQPLQTSITRSSSEPRWRQKHKSIVNNHPSSSILFDYSPELVWEKLKQYAQNNIVCLSGITYSILINAIGKSSIKMATTAISATTATTTTTHAVFADDNNDHNDDIVPIRGEAILQDALVMHKQYPNNFEHPNAATIHSLIHLWSQCQRPEAPERAQLHWDTLRYQWWIEQDRKDCCPTSHTYSAMIHVWANASSSRHYEAANQAELLLQDMENESNKEQRHHQAIPNTATTTKTTSITDPTYVPARPNMVVYTVVLKAWSRSGQCHRAHELLHRMIQRNQEEPSFASENTTGFGTAIATVLEAYRMTIITHHRKKEQKRNLYTMETLLRQMEMLAERTGNHDYWPNTVCYNILMDVYATLGQPRQAESTLQHMMTIYRNSTRRNSMNGCKPDMITWTTVLKAWAKYQSGNPMVVAERMQDILRTMSEFDSSCPPSLHCYSTLLLRYANMANVEGATLAEHLLREMASKGITLDHVAINTVLRAWSKAQDPHQAQAFLDEICAPYYIDSHDRKDSDTHFTNDKLPHPCIKGGTVSIALSRLSSLKSSLLGVTPATTHFNTVMDAWRSKGDMGLIPISTLFRRMDEMHQKWQLPTEPNIVSYSIYLDCLSRSWNELAPQRADELLRHLCARGGSVLPDIVTFDIVVSAWARSDHPESGDRILSLVDLMRHHSIAPDEQLYNLLISSLARKDHPVKAQNILEEMGIIHNVAKGDFNKHQIRPNMVALRSLLQAWARSGNPDEAASTLELMIHEYESGHFESTPATHDFNQVLEAWHNSDQPKELVCDNIRRGLETMRDLTGIHRFNVPPNAHSYEVAISTLISAADNYSGVGGSASVLLTKGGRPMMTDISSCVGELLSEMDNNISRNGWRRDDPLVYARIHQKLALSQVPRKRQLLDQLKSIIEQHHIKHPIRNPGKRREKTR